MIRQEVNETGLMTKLVYPVKGSTPYDELSDEEMGFKDLDCVLTAYLQMFGVETTIAMLEACTKHIQDIVSKKATNFNTQIFNGTIRKEGKS